MKLVQLHSINGDINAINGTIITYSETVLIEQWQKIESLISDISTDNQGSEPRKINESEEAVNFKLFVSSSADDNGKLI